MKTCSKCAAEKSLEDFHLRRSAKDGRYNHCKACHSSIAKARYAANTDGYADRQRAGSSQWRAEHLSEARERERRYRHEHSEKKRAADRRYRDENLERVRAVDRAYYRRNSEVIRERVAQWCKDHPERHLQHRHTRRARLQNAPSIGSAVLMGAILRELLTQPCTYCGATENMTVDHVVPLCRGGAHSPGNVVAACKSCNSQKGRRLLSEWSGPTPVPEPQ